MTKDIKWAIDQSHSEITFKVKHLMIAHSKGAFKIFDANIYTTGKDFETAEIDLWIDPTSIVTGDAKRDTHLKGSDFFDVENHKQITFKSSTIGKKDVNGNHELWGELTIKGITKPVKLDVQFGGVLNDPWGHEKAGFTVTGTIKRSDWGLVWNAAIETGGVMVSEEVSISCDIELTNVNQKELAMELEPSTGKKIGF
ncbi:MAG TPA: YceI family protein [Bacteroidia bacterium]|jgi:polyisoprenoid-binding protein YceI|nr:YceI family protein [Bacteroidia bacterium]